LNAPLPTYINTNESIEKQIYEFLFLSKTIFPSGTLKKILYSLYVCWRVWMGMHAYKEGSVREN